MLVLLDNNVPRGVARALTGHSVVEARERGWAEARNGELLRNAEESGFDVLVTADKNIRYQQNLVGPKDRAGDSHATPLGTIDGYHKSPTPRRRVVSRRSNCRPMARDDRVPRASNRLVG